MKIKKGPSIGIDGLFGFIRCQNQKLIHSYIILQALGLKKENWIGLVHQDNFGSQNKWQETWQGYK